MSVSEHASGITLQSFNWKSVMLNYLACRDDYKCVLFTSLVRGIPFQVSTMSLGAYLGHKKSLLFFSSLDLFLDLNTFYLTSDGALCLIIED